MSDTKITIQETTNNTIIKYNSNTILIHGGSYEFNNIDEAKNSPLAQELFYLPFVKKVFITANFIAIQRFDILEWTDVQEEVKEQIEAFLNEGNAVVNEQKTSKKEAIEVYAEVTPNPAAMKFATNKALTQTDVEFKNIDEASASSPLAQEIFNFPFVKEVFISDNYISVTKYDMVEWDDVHGEVRSFIKEYLAAGKTVIKENDEVYFLVSEGDIDKVVQEMRLQDTSSSRIMIVGGGKIGFSLAQALEEDYKIKILEPNHDRCEYLSKELNRTIVLNGEGSDEELLKNENIENIDVFCALTNDDETNIMSAFLAKKLGAKKTIITLNNYTYINILPKNFVDIALSPQRLTVSMVLQHIAEGDVGQEVILKMGSGAEVIEGIVHKNKFTDPLFGKRVSEMPLPENSVVAAVIRQGTTHLSSKDLLLCEEDRLIIFIADKSAKKSIESLFVES